MAAPIVTITLILAVVIPLSTSTASDKINGSSGSPKPLICKEYLDVCRSGKSPSVMNHVCQKVCGNDHRRSGKCQRGVCCCARNHVHVPSIKKKAAMAQAAAQRNGARTKDSKKRKPIRPAPRTTIMSTTTGAVIGPQKTENTAKNEGEVPPRKTAKDPQETPRKTLICKNYLHICGTGEDPDVMNRKCVYACHNDRRKSGKCQNGSCCCTKHDDEPDAAEMYLNATEEEDDDDRTSAGRNGDRSTNNDEPNKYEGNSDNDDE